MTLPGGRPVSTKLPLLSEIACAIKVPPASCTAMRTPPMPPPSGVMKRPRTPVTPTADCTETRTVAVRAATRPPDVFVAVTEMSWLVMTDAEAEALNTSVPLCPRDRCVGMKRAVTPFGSPVTDNSIKPSNSLRAE